MKVLIIEDEIPAVKRLIQLISELEPEWEIMEHLDEVSIAVNWFKSNPMPDLVFMDIQLADGFSFDIFDQVKLTCPVIFVTAFDNYAVNAFRVNGLDYILKPIQKTLLGESIERFKAIKTSQNIDLTALSEFIKEKKAPFKERFLIKTGEELNFVRSSEVAYFLSEASYSFIVTKSGNRYILDETMDQIEGEVDPSLFFRINRKQIVCLDCITKISSYFNNRLKIELNPVEKQESIVSRTRVKVFKEWLNQ
ncbi:MAG: response regulator [Crocinitomix sp.]|nr:response regulator [Crocinitomix sp.]